MNPDRPSSSTPTAVGSAPPPAPKRRNWLLLGCGGLIALLLVIILTVVITIWWLGHPIKPVVLSAAEKQTVEEKLNQLSSTPADKTRAALATEDKAKPDRIYIPGSKELRLTER